MDYLYAAYGADCNIYMERERKFPFFWLISIIGCW